MLTDALDSLPMLRLALLRRHVRHVSAQLVHQGSSRLRVILTGGKRVEITHRSPLPRHVGQDTGFVHRLLALLLRLFFVLRVAGLDCLRKLSLLRLSFNLGHALHAVDGLAEARNFGLQLVIPLLLIPCQDAILRRGEDLLRFLPACAPAVAELLNFVHGACRRWASSGYTASE